MANDSVGESPSDDLGKAFSLSNVNYALSGQALVSLVHFRFVPASAG